MSGEDFARLAKEFNDFKKADGERWERLLVSQEANTEAIKALAQQTEGVVQLYNDVRGASRVGMGVQRFTIWLAKMGVVGGAVAAFISYVLENFAP